MPIAALPQTTIRAIGSTSVISDPCSVVKELLDNALDASASSLLVEISQNTLDVIQLKDNGHGVPPEDHPFVCKHTFTSKIQTIDDLRSIGGSSLGFRGEALASVAEMSGGVTITTRVASEVTGSCLKYTRDGELSNSQRMSHPEGTTIRITDFMKYIPVRRQAALKSATKNLLAIKKLLQSYAFGQPSKRFSLKVIKAKNENNNWIYAPAADATVSDATTKIVGRDVSSCCVVKQLLSQSPSGEDQPSCDTYQLTAFLPKPDSEMSKANNTGQFVSVDGRPLTTARGIGQDIAKLFKSYVRAAASQDAAIRTISDPFLCLHVKCPRGAYDVNIEPGKDDVLFEDRVLVLSLLEDLLREHFGPLPDSQKKGSTKANAHLQSSTQTNGSFDLLLARKRPDALAAQPNPMTLISSTHVNSSPERTIRSPSASANSTRCVSPGHLNSTPTISEAHNPHHANPWSISRINASFQTPRRENIVSPTASQGPRSGSPTAHRSRQSTLLLRTRLSPKSPELVSPPESRLNSSSPVSRRHRVSLNQGSPVGSYSTRRSARSPDGEYDQERNDCGPLDSWFRRTTQSSVEGTRPALTPRDATEVPSLSELARQRFGQSSDDPIQDMSAEATIAGTRGDNLRIGPSPTSYPQSFSSDSSPDSHQVDEISRDGGLSSVERQTSSLQGRPPTDTFLEIEKAMDFEKRKKEAMQQRHVFLSAPATQSSTQKSSAVSHSPHHKRYLAAKAALATDSDPFYEPTSATSLSRQDPRAYLMRKQGEQDTDKMSNNGSKVQRLNTSRLPFERIPDDLDLHATCLVSPVDLSDVSKGLDISFLSEKSPTSSEDYTAFSSPGVELLVPSWNERLTTLIRQQYQAHDNSRPHGLDIDLLPTITKHLTHLDAL